MPGGTPAAVAMVVGGVGAIVLLWTLTGSRGAGSRRIRRRIRWGAVVLLGCTAAWSAVVIWSDSDDARRDELFGAPEVWVVTLDPLPENQNGLTRVSPGPLYFESGDRRVGELVDPIPESSDLLVVVSESTRYLDVAETADTVTITGYDHCAATECDGDRSYRPTRTVWLAAVRLGVPLGGRQVGNGVTGAVIAPG